MDRSEIVPDAATLTNAPISSDGLPHVDDHPFEPLDPTYARVRSVAAGVAAAIVALVAVVGSVLLSSTAPLIAGAAMMILVAAIGIAQRAETNHMGYLVREQDVSFCSGVIGRSVATAAYARVQHVSLEQGPIDRRFGLAAVQLRTAGGSIAIPGLRHDVAERLKELVADRSATLARSEVDDHTDGGDDHVVPADVGRADIGEIDSDAP